MTISTQASSVSLLGNGVTTSWSIPFIMDSASDIIVTYTDSSNVITTIPSSQYTLTLNPPAVGSLWGVGGVLVYPLSGSPIANGTSLTVSRVLPLTQLITISNQGDFSPQVIEEMGDTLEMQIQQLAARTTQFRGIWVTNTDYNVGDIVQDGVNGNNTNNYYICQVQNTSGTWSTDLAAGDWAISVTATIPSSSNTLTLTGDISASGAISGPIATTLATVNSKIGQYAGLTVNAKGLVTAATALTGDITSAGAATTLATVNSNIGSFTNANITVNGKGLITAASSGANAAGAAVLLNSQTVSSSVSAVSVTTNINSSYSHYVWEISNLIASTGGVDALITVQQGGVFLNSGEYLSSGVKSVAYGGTFGGIGDPGFNYFNATGGVGGVGTLATNGPSVVVFEFWNPSQAKPLAVMFRSFQSAGSGGPGYTQSAGYTHGTAAATTGVKITLSSTVSIVSCTANLYGIT